MKYLIIGAGPCGLAMARHLNEAGIPYLQVDMNYEIGGNWYNGVYKGVFTDACKDVMCYDDFPMPDSYTDFISGEQMLAYLKSYVKHFNLMENIRLGIAVEHVSQRDDKSWQVRFKGDEKEEVFDGVIVCNGHHRDMRWPELSGQFAGLYIHSKQYKEPAQLNGKRVLVIGSGNSASDIACEAARIGTRSVLSMRDSPWIFPKSFMGVPLGRLKARNLPLGLQMILVRLLVKLSFGKHEHYNLPAPRHKIFEKHPTVSEELPYYLKHGRIGVKPEVSFISKNTVWFKDGSSEEFDLIVAATGYHLSFPFLDSELTRVEAQNLRCVGHCVYPDIRGLYFVGWQQVRGGVGALSYKLASMVVDLIQIEQETGVSAGEIFVKMGDTTSETNLYGNYQFSKFIERHNYDKMLNVANKIMRSKHRNRIS